MRVGGILLSMFFAPAAGFAGLESLSSAHDAIAPFLEHPTTVATAAAANLGGELLAGYKHALATEPLQTKMITGATLAACGDAIAQKQQEDKYDPRRGASFMAFDACYRALQHTLFPPIVKYCDGHFLLGAVAAVPPLAQLVQPETADPFFYGAMEQTLASQLGIVPFLYYPVFFTLTGFVQGLSAEGSIQRAKDTFIPLMKRNLLFWIPVQFVQFGFIEEGLQIPFLCVCGLAWTFILSVMAGSTKNYCVTGSETDCQLPEDLFPHEGDDYIIVDGRASLEGEIDSFVQAALDRDEASAEASLGINGASSKTASKEEKVESLTR